MPLKTPQSALIFNNFIESDKVSNFSSYPIPSTDINFLSLIGDFYYDFSKNNISKTILELSPIQHKKESLEQFIVPVKTKAFNEIAVDKNLNTIVSLYNQGFFTLISAKDVNVNLKNLETLVNSFIQNLSSTTNQPYVSILQSLSYSKNNKLFKNSLEIDQVTFALLDYFFTTSTSSLQIPYVKSRIGQVGLGDIIDFKAFKKADGVYSNFLRQIKDLIEKNEFTIGHFNIELNNSNFKEIPIKIISPTTFYELAKELKKEPKVPEAANENQIINFYQDLFTKKYPSKDYDKATFLYKNYNPKNLETEVLLLSSLLNKSKTYVEFEKPYASIEFYIDNKQNALYRTSSFYNNIKNQKDKIRYLSRFARSVSGEQDSSLDAAFLKDGSAKIKKIYRSFKEHKLDTDLNPESFETNIDISNLKNVPKVESNDLTDLVTLKQNPYCYYDIVGYLITKSKDNVPIKRVFILNDVLSEGIVKYFDSQIIENKNYSYKIEQINNIFGKDIQIGPPIGPPKAIFLNPNFVGQKDVFKFKKKGEDDLEVLFQGSIQDDKTEVAKKSDEDFLPFYKDEKFFTEFSTKIKETQMVSYSPIVDVGLGSPDLKLGSITITTPPSPPDLKIYSKKGESKNILIVLSNLIYQKLESTGLLENKDIKIVDLGSVKNEQLFETKEFRVFRTEDKPTSFDSFSKTPRKIIDPKFPDFIDQIEPNVTYYYYADAVNAKDIISKPSKILKFEMVEEQGHIFPLLEVYDFGEDKEIITEKLFKKKIRISPTFLQSALGTNYVLKEQDKVLLTQKEKEKLSEKSQKQNLKPEKPNEQAMLLQKDNSVLEDKPIGIADVELFSSKDEEENKKQLVVNPVIGYYVKQTTDKDGFTSKLFGESSQILNNTQKPSHKIRITSKKTRRRFDLNVIFSYLEKKDFKEIPENAVLVLEVNKKEILSTKLNSNG